MTLPRALFDQLVEHARSQAPNESCGLLGGRDGVLRSFHPTRNASASPTLYTVHPDDALRSVLEIEDAGDELAAIYHSHPATPAYPSATDLRLATVPDAAYLILSLASEPPQLRAFRLAGGTIRELELAVDEAGAAQTSSPSK